MAEAADVEEAVLEGEPAAEPVLLRSNAEGVVGLTLNRPDQYNALSRELLAKLQTELDLIKDDPDVRVVVITGTGRAFCAGHDLKEMAGERERGRLLELFGACSKMMLSLTRLPQPVIALIDGIATAAGCQLVAACDLALATTNARFATSGVKYGLFCSTPMVALARNLPRKPAMEMLLTGDFIEADDALRLGLVNQVVAPDKLEEAFDAPARAAARQAARGPGARQARLLPSARDGARGRLRLHHRGDRRQCARPRLRGGPRRISREASAGVAEPRSMNDRTNPRPARRPGAAERAAADARTNPSRAAATSVSRAASHPRPNEPEPGGKAAAAGARARRPNEPEDRRQRAVWPSPLHRTTERTRAR